MTTKKYGKKYSNAEVTIDYDKKKIEFYHNNKDYNKKFEKLMFFSHNLYQVPGYIIGLLSGLIAMWYFDVFSNWHWLMGTNYVYMGYPWQFDVLVASFILIIYFLTIFSVRYIFGMISVLVHKYSKTARKNFPISNAAIFGGKIEWDKVEFKPDKEVYPSGFVSGNKYYTQNYGIVRFDYTYIGDNKIKKFYTKSTEHEKHKGEHYKYAAIFEFEKPLTEGVLMYR